MAKVMNMETWRKFRDGTYEVSDLGNVRRAKPGISTFVGRPVAPVMSAGGYQQAQVKSEGKYIRAYVHRLVAECFFGPCPSGSVVNHKDGNKQNNALTNLEYATYRENSLHAFALLGRRRGPKKPPRELRGRPSGDKHWTKCTPEKICRGEKMHSKVTEDDVIAIKYLTKIGRTQISSARRFGLSVAQVSRIVRGSRWGHIKDTEPVKMTLPEWMVTR